MVVGELDCLSIAAQYTSGVSSICYDVRILSHEDNIGCAAGVGGNIFVIISTALLV